MRRGTTTAAVAAAVVTSVIGTALPAGAADTVVQETLDANLPVHDTSGALDWDTATETLVELDGTSATVTGTGASADGGTVTVTAPGTYRVRGTLMDGAVVVASSGDGVVRLVLDGASITSSTTAPLQVADADEVVVVLADGSSNTLTDPATYVLPEGEDEPNAALFSKEDLTIAGSGSLTVNGNANDGIASKDGLVVAGGTITVRAVDDGLRGKDYLVVTGGRLDVTAGGDGLKSDDDAPEAGFVHVAGGSLTVSAGDDGITAASDTVVSGGHVDVTAGGGASGGVDGARGIIGDVSVVLGGGTVVVDASDDAVKSDGTVTVANGSARLSSSQDGIDALERIAITGGAVDVVRSHEGLEAKVVDIAGGLVGVVAEDDAINGSDPSQPDAMGVIPGVAVNISGGRLLLRAATGDGLDSNGVASMTGGTVYIDGPTEFINSAVDTNGEFQVSGGVLVGASSGGLVGAPATSSPQGWVSANSEQPAGTLVHVLAGDGTVVASLRTDKAAGNFVVSHPAIVNGQQYSLAVGGSASGRMLGGYYETPGDATGANVVATVTAGTAPGFGGGWGGGWPGFPGQPGQPQP